MKKAGNLRYAFARTSGDAVVIFEADFCPKVWLTDFLKDTTPYLSDPAIGILQTPQYFRLRRERTWVEQGAAVSQEFFYRMVQTNQDRFSGSVCVGSCGLYRRSAVEPFGGVVPISHSEDMYTGFNMTELGYKIKYLPHCLAMGTCPDEPRSFFMQQYRWCMGSATLVSEKGFWAADLSFFHSQDLLLQRASILHSNGTVPLSGADPHYPVDLSQGRFGAVVLQRFRGSLDLDGNRCNAYMVQAALRDVGAQGPGHPVLRPSFRAEGPPVGDSGGLDSIGRRGLKVVVEGLQVFRGFNGSVEYLYNDRYRGWLYLE
ncbi:unnamed protein product, partial [Ectocarpus fasciculatus]